MSRRYENDREHTAREGAREPGSYRNAPNPTRLYRDRQNAKLAGVCAGVGEYFDLSVCGVRWVTAIATLFAPFTIVIYFAMAIFLPTKPQELYKDVHDEQFWRQVRSSPAGTFSEVKHTFREMEAKLQRLERYVTSSRFKLDQEFRDLERDR